MSNIIMSGIYNHYMTTYSPKKTDARLDSHNRNELKHIYGNILKLNKEAPLYIYDRSPQTASFALALKENTRQLQHTILDSTGNSETALFKNKTAFSTDESVISAQYINENTDASEDPASLEIEVYSLASPQVNMGYFLPSQEQSVSAGNYSFGVKINNFTYEFDFAVADEDTNLDVQSKLARMLNHSNIGLSASVVEGEEQTTSLKIESLHTGESNTSDAPLFLIENTMNEHNGDIVDFLGIDYIASHGSNAHFSINGAKSSSPTNELIVDDVYAITLNGVSPESGEPAIVGVKTNTESLKNNIYHLVGGYNTFLQAADQYKTLVSSGKLNYEIQSVAKLYRNELDAVGISLTNSGALSINDDLLSQSAQSEEAYELLSPLKDFSSSLYKKGEEISRDPLHYVNKKMVAYKNPGKNFPSPYASSNYSGLLFNFYC